MLFEEPIAHKAKIRLNRNYYEHVLKKIEGSLSAAFDTFSYEEDNKQWQWLKNTLENTFTQHVRFVGALRESIFRG